MEKKRNLILIALLTPCIFILSLLYNLLVNHKMWQGIYLGYIEVSLKDPLTLAYAIALLCGLIFLVFIILNLLANKTVFAGRDFKKDGLLDKTKQPVYGILANVFYIVFYVLLLTLGALALRTWSYVYLTLFFIFVIIAVILRFVNRT